MRLLLALALLVLALPARAAVTPPASAEARAQAQAERVARSIADVPPGQRYALVVGIDDYPPGTSDLNSCVADARLVADLLINRFGFPLANVRVLTDRAATRQAILDGFRGHLAQAGPGGAAVFYFSGHGLQMNANLAAPDPEADGRDEAIYVWDTKATGTVLLDDELAELTAGLAGMQVLVALDACNSGTGTRGDAGRPKRVRYADVADALALPAAYAVSDDLGDKIGAGWDASLDGHVLLAAADDDEVAYTGSGWPDRGGVASVFTYFLVSELDRAGPTASLADVMQRVRARTLQHGRRNGQLQTPQLEGAAGGTSLGAFLGG